MENEDYVVVPAEPGNRLKIIDIALLVLRLGLGAIFLSHGIPKLLGSEKQSAPELWTMLGGAMGVFGIHFWPTFWGFMAAFAEAFGGLALVLGILVRPFAILLLINMIVASAFLMKSGAQWAGLAHPVTLAVVFLFLALAGGGPHALGRRIPGLSGQWWQ